MARVKKVTEKEKKRMWQLYQDLQCYKAVAKKMRRSPDTVSRHVQAYEAAIRAAGYVMNAEYKGM